MMLLKKFYSYRYKSSSVTGDRRFRSVYTSYPAGGYIATIHKDNAEEVIKEMIVRAFPGIWETISMIILHSIPFFKYKNKTYESR